MKIRYLYHKQVGDPKAVKLSTEDWIRRIRQEWQATKAEADQFKGYLEIIADPDQRYELDIPEDWDKADRERVKALFKAVEKAYKASLDYEADMKEEEEAQKIEAAKRGQQIVVGAEKGRALANMAASHLVKDIATAMKGKFVMDGAELVAKESANV